MQQIKCAYEPCTCTIEVGEQYCSRFCKEEASQQALSSGGCRCGHSACESR